MMSRQMSTHSSQMNTVGPAISFLTSRWLLLQKLHLSASSPVSFFGIGSSALPRLPVDGSVRDPRSRGVVADRGAVHGTPRKPRTGRLRPAIPTRRAAGPLRQDPAEFATGANHSRSGGPEPAGLGPPPLHHPVDQAVLHGLVGGEDLVALRVAVDLFLVLAGVAGQDLVDADPQRHHVAGVDLDVALLALEAVQPGLVDEHPAVGQDGAL